MKTDSTPDRRDSTSASGAAWAAGTSAPDCTASQIKNCLILTEPAILGRREVSLLPQHTQAATKTVHAPNTRAQVAAC